MNTQIINYYGLLMIAGILLTTWIWGRFTAREKQHDGRLVLIYFCGLLGAFLGAKLAFLIAEGWHYRDNWIALLSGRSITGGLLGGYAAVEIAKKYLRYAHTTGDLFAIVAPIGLMLGRVGCLLQGCCPGTVCDASHWWTIADHDGLPRWPAAVVELLFNGTFLVWAFVAMRRNWAVGNRFHIYLIAYGLFRFAHEFVRDDSTYFGVISGYHLIALAIAGFGLWKFVERRRAGAGAKQQAASSAPLIVSDIAPT